MVVDNAFWRGRRVLVSGHTGFKGAWLTLWLQKLGAQVAGVSLEPDDDRAAFSSMAPWGDLRSAYADIRHPSAYAELCEGFRPEVVFHLAAQALLTRAYERPDETWDINVVGTMQFLDVVRHLDTVRAVVVSTTDKVYFPTESPATEQHDLGGTDAYSRSKCWVERAVAGLRSEGRPRPVFATVRAGNVIGGGDRGQHRLLPDLWRALEAGIPLRIRHPDYVRPWQFVLDAMHGYILLAQALYNAPEKAPRTVNLGPGADGELTVEEIVTLALAGVEGGSWIREERPDVPENPVLRLNVDLARTSLGWKALLPADIAVEWTVEWWKAAANGQAMREVGLAQLDRYESRAVAQAL